VGAGNRIGNRPLVVNVGLDRSKLRIIDAEQAATSIRMPRCDPHRKRPLPQSTNDAAAEKPGSAEHGDGAIVGGRHRHWTRSTAGERSSIGLCQHDVERLEKVGVSARS
jgi:hypothetical protein